MGEPRPATIGGRYVLAGEIAAGGMATVHLARQVGAAGFARIVAVKRLHDRFSRDPDFVGMFLDEARLVARIRHTNVVQTVDVVAEGGELFLVMEYVPGESLFRLLLAESRRGRAVAVPVACAVLSGVLRGLHEAHEARSESGAPLGIVHRDVSPQNVLVGLDGVARVLDFGVAKATQRVQTTQQGHIKGKLSYMAPEQMTNRPLDRRVDVYAAAVVLWELLAGRKLFAGSSEGAVLAAVLLGDVPPPSRFRRDVPPALDAVVLRGLARDPDARFATALEMSEAIGRAAPLATASEVAAWVREAAAQSLAERAELVARVEAQSSVQSLRCAVDSLRSLTPSSAGHGEGTPPGYPFGTPSSPLPSSAPPAAAASSQAASSPPVALDAPLAPSAPRGRSRAALAAVVAATAAVLATGAAGVFLLARGTGPGAAAAPRPASVPAAPAATAASAAAPSACPSGMVRVEAGRFFMGSDDDRPEERPAHHVTLHAFCIDRHEVTTDAYRACSDRGDCKRAATTNRWEGISTEERRVYDPLCNAHEGGRGAHPVNCVDWEMAARYCRAEGKRLPTEAEWEYAARGSDGRRYPWGDAPPSASLLNACGSECAAWGRAHHTSLDLMYASDDGWAATAPVGSFPAGASRWDAEDMVGNVWEWVDDWYARYDAGDQTDPRGPREGTTRVIRGGAWNGANADWVRPTYRFHSAPGTRSHGIGFRCAADAADG